jgi:hypothetical protein
VFPDKPAARVKGCPKDSFLSLCEIGVVHHVSPGAYTESEKNKRYIIAALAALRADPELAHNRRRLWQIATEGADVRPNGQLDVITTLWRRGLIRELAGEPSEDVFRARLTAAVRNVQGMEIEDVFPAGSTR